MTPRTSSPPTAARPNGGAFRLDRLDITQLGERRMPAVRLRQVGFVLQDFNRLSALTVLENVAVVATLAGARRNDARRRAEAVLRELGLGERLGCLPEKLSGGMSVDLEQAVAGERDGRVFHFCSRGRKAEFMVDPPSFVGSEAGGTQQ